VGKREPPRVMASPGPQSPIAATSMAGPWGPIRIAASERGVIALELLTPAGDFAARVGRRLGRPIRWIDPAEEAQEGGGSRATERDRLSVQPAKRVLATAVVALTAWLAGDDSLLATLPLDLEDRPAWDRQVLAAVRSIPRGETRGYGEVARIIGRAGAARAVGGAVGRSPVGIVIPCHRVIAGDGTLGGYGGGWWGERERLLDLKAALLAREGVIVRRRSTAAVTPR
jgi:methylated-DNA-[protein]-cysteine S-methyltransferase